MNSLLQALYSLGSFRSIVYTLEGEERDDESESVLLCLQRIFFNLQTGDKAVRTSELLKALGFNE